jgi:preprotein translocase subunit SecD
VIASAALLIYALLTFSLFKLIPITLTLPGVAGFILSLGMAVDANVLIFERLREEMREGRNLRQATDLGFNRAWPSIRDSNLSTLITCFILFWFGSTFGASIVQGFALTLGIGVLVSMFTAIVVTRTLLHLVLDRIVSAEHPAFFGVQVSR